MTVVAEWDLSTTELGSDVGFLLAKASAVASRQTNAAVRPFGLSVRTYSALALACEPTPPTQRELARGLSLDPSQIVQIVDDLEHPGFVERVADPNDRRQKRVRATDRGRRQFADARSAADAAAAEGVGGLPAAHVDVLLPLLQQIVFTA